MQQSALQILLISLLVVCSACGSYQPKGVEITENTISEYVNPYFSDTNSDYIYKANMAIFGKQSGGIVIIKKINDTFHRVVFTTDFGNKLLDFEVSADSFKINFVVDGFNNKRILKVLETDFRLLLQPTYTINQTFATPDKLIYASKQNKNFVYLFESKEDRILSELVFTKHSKEKITFGFQNKTDTFAEIISIKHHNIPLEINLLKI